MGACPCGNAMDATSIDERSIVSGAALNARGWMLQSFWEELLEGSLLHLPDGMQHSFWPAWLNMKYCAQEMQPPHSNAAANTSEKPRLAIFLNTMTFSA